MRYFWSHHLPEVQSVLLVESGARSLLETLVPTLRQTWGQELTIDLFTCYARTPRGLEGAGVRVYRSADYRTRAGRRALYRELAANRYSLIGIVCSGEPILAKWKWALAFRVPAKVFVINENADFFWLDRGHLGILRELVFLRSGLAGEGAVRTLARILSFPFTLMFLLLYATAVHTRRALRRG